MTVLTTSSDRTFAGNGVTTSFATGFLFLDNDHITVTLIDSGGTETAQVEDVDYTLTGAGDVAGGNVVMVTAPASGESLYIERTTPILQEVDLRPNGPYLPDTIEEMFDRLTLIAQEDRRRLEALEALGDLVDISDATGTQVSHDFTTDADNPEDTFPFDITVPGGEAARAAAFIVFLRDDPTLRFDTSPTVQWIPSSTDKITIVGIDGLATGATYTISGLVFL